ncbi:uncharacterized protein LOC144006607 isoform X2 [Festucalex cinctus]
MLSKRRWTFQDLLKSAHLSSYRGWRIVGTRLGLFTPRDAAFLTSLIFKQEELLKPQEESFLFQSKDVREKPPAGRAGVLGSASGQALLWSAQTQQRNLGRTPQPDVAVPAAVQEGHPHAAQLSVNPDWE